MGVNKLTTHTIKINPIIHNGKIISSSRDVVIEDYEQPNDIEAEAAVMETTYKCSNGSLTQAIKEIEKIVGTINIDEQLAKIHSEE